MKWYIVLGSLNRDDEGLERVAIKLPASSGDHAKRQVQSRFGANLGIDYIGLASSLPQLPRRIIHI